MTLTGATSCQSLKVTQTGLRVKKVDIEGGWRAHVQAALADTFIYTAAYNATTHKLYDLPVTKHQLSLRYFMVDTRRPYKTWATQNMYMYIGKFSWI